MYRMAFDHTPIGLAFLTPDRGLIRVNPALCAILGYTEDELKRIGIDALTHPDDRTLHIGVQQELIDGRRTSYELEKRYLHRDGRVIWTSLQVGSITDDSGQVKLLVSQIQDVTTRVETHRRTAWLATHDPLTGAANRLAMFDELLHVATTKLPQLAVLYIDLDGFKKVNDLHGHATGDRYLVRIVDRLTRVVRETDTVARIGGDEFAVIAHGVGNRAKARSLAEGVRSAVNHLALELHDPPLVSVSIGVALTPATSADDLLARADAALYRAKNGGRNRTVVEGDAATSDGRDAEPPHADRSAQSASTTARGSAATTVS